MYVLHVWSVLYEVWSVMIHMVSIRLSSCYLNILTGELYFRLPVQVPCVMSANSHTSASVLVPGKLLMEAVRVRHARWGIYQHHRWRRARKQENESVSQTVLEQPRACVVLYCLYHCFRHMTSFRWIISIFTPARESLLSHIMLFIFQSSLNIVSDDFTDISDCWNRGLEHFFKENILMVGWWAWW